MMSSDENTANIADAEAARVPVLAPGPGGAGRAPPAASTSQNAARYALLRPEEGDRDAEALISTPSAGLGPPPGLTTRRRFIFIAISAATLCTVVVLAGLIFAGYGPRREVERTPLILVSLDGFRWDYMEKYHEETSNLRSIARRGMRAQKFIPVFPSKTFPNHYTIVTGLYPEHHGIVSNNMYDPALGHFQLSDANATGDGRWWGGTPLWVSAVAQGVRAGTVFWPGSSAAIRNVRPTYWLPYNKDMTMDQRVGQLLAWLDLPADRRPALTTLYMEPVDTAGHEHGPDSAEVRAAVRRVDDAVGLLLVGLQVRGILDKVNILVVSDHGMTSLSPERVVTLDSYLDLGPQSGLFVVDWSPVLAIRPNSTATEDRAYAALKKAHVNVAVYEREMVPERLHYRDNVRIMPFLGIADMGWTITSRAEAAAHPEWLVGGNHGYDPHAGSDMLGIFLGQGPGLRAGGVDVGEIRNIDVYALACALLGIEAAPADGSLAAVRHVLA